MCSKMRKEKSALFLAILSLILLLPAARSSHEASWSAVQCVHCSYLVSCTKPGVRAPPGVAEILGTAEKYGWDGSWQQEQQLMQQLVKKFPLGLVGVKEEEEEVQQKVF